MSEPPPAPAPPPESFFLDLPPTDSDIHLFTASRAGDETRVQELMSAGANPQKYRDEFDNTALLEAASLGKNTIVSMLLYGADLSIQNNDGNTALHRAADNGHNEVTKRLIEAKADLNMKNNEGNTALHRAANSGHNEVTTRLIDAGADLNIQNNVEDTAVHCAADRGHNEVVINLFLSGADMNKQNKDWETPPHYPIARLVISIVYMTNTQYINSFMIK